MKYFVEGKRPKFKFENEDRNGVGAYNVSIDGIEWSRFCSVRFDEFTKTWRLRYSDKTLGKK